MSALKGLGSTPEEKTLVEVFERKLSVVWPYAKASSYKSFDDVLADTWTLIWGDFHQASTKAALLHRCDYVEAVFPLCKTSEELLKLTNAMVTILRKLHSAKDPLQDKVVKQILRTPTPELVAYQVKATRKQVSQMKVVKYEDHMSGRTKLVRDHLAHELKTNGKQIGNAIDNGDCFYDAIAVPLSAHLGEQVTVKKLRMAVFNYFANLHQTNPLDNWAKATIEKTFGGQDSYTDYMNKVQYTGEELDLKGDLSIWGRPDLEGKMLSEIYDINIRVHSSDMVPVFDGAMAAGVSVAYTDNEGQQFALSYVADNTDKKRKNVIDIGLYPGHFVAVLSGGEKAGGGTAGFTEEELQAGVREAQMLRGVGGGSGDPRKAKMTDAERARLEHEAMNEIIKVDKIYEYDEALQNKSLESGDYLKEVEYFKNAKLSAVALLKMVMHSKGSNKEVVGLLRGKVEGKELVVMDLIPLNTEVGDKWSPDLETKARATVFEAMQGKKMPIASKKKKDNNGGDDDDDAPPTSAPVTEGRPENIIGWYRSHPGYGAFMSAVDLKLDMLIREEVHRQADQTTLVAPAGQMGAVAVLPKVDVEPRLPWLSFVIDPIRTAAAGQVEVKAFRAYPSGHTGTGASRMNTFIPRDKAEDFRESQNKYYPLAVTNFKSRADSALLDSLWKTYWVTTLSSNSVLSLFNYFSTSIDDIASKLENAEQSVSRGGLFRPGDRDSKKSELATVVDEMSQVGIEQMRGVLTQVVKQPLFNEFNAA